METPAPINLLWIAPEKGPAGLFMKSLRELPGAPAMTTAASLKDALKLIPQETFHAALLSLDLPGISAAEAAAKLAVAAPSLPLFILAEPSREEEAVAALEKGARHYFVPRDGNAGIFLRLLRHVVSANAAGEDISLTIKKLAGVNQELYKFAQELGNAHEKLRKDEIVKTERLSTASHQMRTPLTSIHGYISMLLEGHIGTLNEKQTTFLSRVRMGAERLHRLLNDLLDLAKIESESLKMAKQWTDPAEWLEQEVIFFKPQAEARKIDLSLQIKGPLEKVYCDPDWIKEAVSNLISNAIKYNRENGRIVVGAERAGDFLLIRVEDTGIGIDTADLGGIFEPFYNVRKSRQQKQDSTGLGLSLVKKITESHGGSVGVQSEPGKGSCFSMRIPAGEKGAETA
ncbi:MAG TPA: HAMP domain-containing sensor histidine kinase [Verrucomicrobiae bacterium]|jgi:signal transduction histidine kinase|nr:HAMP domain-containing sensor histidine kinase [Verrucomicrobiae bacterium]